MYRLLSCVVLFLVTCTSGVTTRDEGRHLPLTILHWNDFHAHNTPYSVTVRDTVAGKDTTYFVGGSATVAGYIDSLRQTLPRVLVLNAGDDFQGSPISSFTLGRSQIELMNIIRPDAMALGNHEFDYGAEPLRENIQITQFPVLCANVWDETNSRTFVAASTITTKNGIRIGLIGLVAPDLPTLVVRDRLQGLKMLDIDSVLRRYIHELQSAGVDLLVVVSHMGIHHDKQAAQKHPEIDIIVGGHDHLTLYEPIRERRTIIVQAGQWGQYMGKLDLTVDIAGDSLYTWSGQLVEMRTADIAPNPLAAKKVAEFEAQVGDMMKEVIGRLTEPWKRSREQTESNIGNWQADAMLAYANADVAFQNNGGIRKDLDAGEITVGDTWGINPFGNHFVTFRVNGVTLRSMIAFQTEVSMREFVQVGGLRYVFDSSQPTGQKLISVEVGGKVLDDRALYTVVTNNYVFSNLEAHFGLRGERFTPTELPDLDRDVFIELVRRERTITPKLDGRIKDIAPKTE